MTGISAEIVQNPFGVRNWEGDGGEAVGASSSSGVPGAVVDSGIICIQTAAMDFVVSVKLLCGAWRRALYLEFRVRWY